jgi:hypothetical protein
VRAAATRKGGIVGSSTGAEANAELPAFRLPLDWDVVVCRKNGGIL